MNPNYIQNLIKSIDEQELLHYASDYYDPAKAHEYYMQNRQLKGRTTVGISDEGKEVWNATKANITTDKKNQIKAYSDQKEIDIKNARVKAETTRISITNKLKALSETLNSKYKSDSEGLTKEQKEQLKVIDRQRAREIEQVQSTKSRKIEKINEDDDLSSKEKAAKKGDISEDVSEDVQDVREEYSKKSEEVRTETSAKKQKLSTEKKAESTKNSTEAKTERTKVATELKGAIQAARDMYATNKKSVEATFEGKYQDEYEQIKSEYQKPERSKKKKSK